MTCSENAWKEKQIPSAYRSRKHGPCYDDLCNVASKHIHTDARSYFHNLLLSHSFYKFIQKEKRVTFRPYEPCSVQELSNLKFMTLNWKLCLRDNLLIPPFCHLRFCWKSHTFTATMKILSTYELLLLKHLSVFAMTNNYEEFNQYKPVWMIIQINTDIIPNVFPL